MKKALICFTRVPRPGQTKTRLLPLLKPEQCAQLHWAFLRDLAEIYSQMQTDLFVFHTPDPHWAELRPVFPMAKGFYPQEGRDLGEKMDHALRTVLALGYNAVVLTGADLPGLTAAHLESGFSALEKADLALGPTADGGYYLIGTNRPCPEVFTNQQYGGATVYENTMAAAKAAGYTVCPALVCADVDTPEDLRSLRLSPGSHTARYLELLRKDGIK